MSLNLKEPTSTRRLWAGLLTRGPRSIASPALRAAVTILILAGAVLTVISGVIHLHLWAEPNGYRKIPTIGPLFLAQGISAILIGLLAAVSRWLGAVLAAAGLMASTAIGLVISVEHGLFGFKDSLLVPYAKTSLYEEIIGTVVLLAAAWPLARARAGSHAARR